ncbi:MAG: pyridoxine 5'-phosphate synthase [Candidatus Ratteibacteria bacterium]|jgi:pyridoxine 5-phosphate synthase
MKKKKLGVNIDHVATLRQARRGTSPDPVIAAGICELAGSDSIVCHLREDRRHIQDRDVRLLRQTIRTRLNLEMAVSEEIISLALEVLPDQVTLVPEKREELTTEGGLDAVSMRSRLKETEKRFCEKGIAVCLFIEPDFAQIETAKEVGATAVELHTGTYADYCGEKNESSASEELIRLAKGAKHASSLGLRTYAGHGLDYQNIFPVLAIEEFEEFNIGYSIICRSVFTGLWKAVQEMHSLISRRVQ